MSALVDALVALALDLAHEADPAERARKAREGVEAQLARLRAADPGALGPRLDAQEQAARVRLAAAARTLRDAALPPVMRTPDVDAALSALIEHHDPQP